jgi:hypothetical protein|tara:strand:- start:5 stop:358 length:354 start_codon:yes stop_codon:yes gene_type:complete
MEFKIKDLILDTYTPYTSSLSKVVNVVHYEFVETVGSNEISKELFQPLDHRAWNTSSFTNHSNLTEEQVKGWVTSSFENLDTEIYLLGKTHPSSSWSEFVSSVSSSLNNEVLNDLPW